MHTMSKHDRAWRRLQSHHVSSKCTYLLSQAWNLTALNRCRCKFQFCYECGRHWKNCTCIVYDEAMLLRRARVVAHREVAPGAGAPAAAVVARIANNLRERHNCDHDGRWNRVEGAHRCEECGYHLRSYILQCRHCMLQACVRCKRNRL